MPDQTLLQADLMAPKPAKPPQLDLHAMGVSGISDARLVKLACSALAFAGLAVLTACAKPLPPDRADYAGDWRGNGVSLLITEGGHVVYHRREGGTNVSIDAPIKRFDGDDFEVGLGPLVTRFDVGQPPTEKDGEWTMEVDGRILRREDDGGSENKAGIKA